MAVDHTLMCTFCDGFLTEPKDLPCKHSFCEACLQTHCLTSASEDSFPCPTCKKPVKVKDPNTPLFEWPSAIPTNKVTSGRLEKMHVIEKERRQYKCVLCGQKWLAVRATKYCKSCEEYFCDECGTQHWLLRASKDHRVYLVEEMTKLKQDPYLRSQLMFMFNTRVKEPRKRPGTEGLFTGGSSNRLVPDVDDCDISGATFLDNGQVALADKGNGRVKLFDRHFGFVSSIDLHCHDLLQLNKYFIVASCPVEKCLKYVSLYKNEFEIDRTVELNSECYGLCHVNEKTGIFVVALGGRPLKLAVYEGSKLKQTINVSNGKMLLLRPDYVTYDTKRKIYYLSDSMNTCLKCVKDTGELVWEKKIPQCRGLAVFHEYLLVARSDRKTVDIINTSAQIIKSVVTLDDGLSKVCVLCRDHLGEGDNSIRILVVDDTELARVFAVENPLMDTDLKSYLSQDDNNSSRQGSTSSLRSDKGVKTTVCVIL